MLSFQQARDIAENYIHTPGFSKPYEIVIADNYIIEKPYAWIFPYNTKRALEGDIFASLGGNSPIFVDKQDGNISIFPSYLSLEGMIDKYEEERQIWHLKLTSNAYAETGQLRTLKRLLNLSQGELAALKINKSLVIDKGSKTRLESLAELLAKNGIHSEVVLASEI